MTKYLGGPEDAESLIRRHARYLDLARSGTGEMFTIAFGREYETAGTTGYWQKTWRENEIYETGWQIFPTFAGRGIATQAALAIVALLRKRRDRRFLHAFPSVENAASNRVCENAGFTNGGETQFEYPPGRLMTCFDWYYDLAPNAV